MNEPLALVITLTIFDIEIGIRSGSRRLLHRVRQLRDSRKVSPHQDGLCGCGSVGRAVASDTKGPRFESSRWQIFTYLLNICLLSAVY